MRALLLPLTFLLGCGEAFKPETLVTQLRVLGMKAEPASLRPGETASLSALVVDPSRPGRENSIVWLGCEPDPLNLGRTACSNTQTVIEPSELGQDASALPPGMSVIGFNNQAFYSVKSDLFAELPEGDVQRKRGTVGQIIALVVAESLSPAATQDEIRALLAKVRAREVGSVVVLFRILVSESPEINRNPTIETLVVENQQLPSGWTLRMRPKATLTMSVAVPETDFESFTAFLPDKEEVQTERLSVSWYSTMGEFSETRVALNSEGIQTFTAPETSEKRNGSLYTVARDTRGGQSWKSFPLFLCDESLAVPQATEVQVTGNDVVLFGDNLSSVLEVIVGNVALEEGEFSALSGTYSARMPSLPAGSYPVLLRGKHCSDVETGLTVTLP